MSPLLFNLYTSKIINFIPRNTSILQFADDVLILLYSINRNIKSAETNINLALQQLNLFYSLNLKLHINSEKSSVMVLGNDITSVKVLYNNKQIPLVNEYQCLLYICDMEKVKKNVLIISDSMSVLLSLDNYKLSYKLNYLIYLIRKIILIVVKLQHLTEFHLIAVFVGMRQ